jgi:hypothetical protein
MSILNGGDPVLLLAISYDLTSDWVYTPRILFGIETKDTPKHVGYHKN